MNFYCPRCEKLYDNPGYCIQCHRIRLDLSCKKIAKPITFYTKNWPFVDNLEFCEKHTPQSLIKDVVECQQCRLKEAA